MTKVIEGYVLYEEVGRGSYGQVFRATHQQQGRDYAVKVITRNVLRDNPKLEQMLLNEIDVLSNIRNDHVVRYIQTIKTLNNFYFVYEYCEGGTLEQLFRQKGLFPQNQAFLLLRQLLAAFKELNKLNVVHRDLKPSNILLSGGVIKLGDFGFSRSLQHNLAQTMLGSPLYMAPQVLKEQIYTLKADIWSLGVVLYESLFGVCPFQSKSIQSLISAHQGPPLELPLHLNNISEELQRLLLKMLTRDQFQRIDWHELFQLTIDDKGRLLKNRLDQMINNFHHAAPSASLDISLSSSRLRWLQQNFTAQNVQELGSKKYELNMESHKHNTQKKQQKQPNSKTINSAPKALHDQVRPQSTAFSQIVSQQAQPINHVQSQTPPFRTAPADNIFQKIKQYPSGLKITQPLSQQIKNSKPATISPRKQITPKNSQQIEIKNSFPKLQGDHKFSFKINHLNRIESQQKQSPNTSRIVHFDAFKKTQESKISRPSTPEKILKTNPKQSPTMNSDKKVRVLKATQPIIVNSQKKSPQQIKQIQNQISSNSESAKLLQKDLQSLEFQLINYRSEREKSARKEKEDVINVEKPQQKDIQRQKEESFEEKHKMWANVVEVMGELQFKQQWEEQLLKILYFYLGKSLREAYAAHPEWTDVILEEEHCIQEGFSFVQPSIPDCATAVAFCRHAPKHHRSCLSKTLKSLYPFNSIDLCR